MTVANLVPDVDREQVWASTLGQEDTPRKSIRNRIITRAQLSDLPEPEPLIAGTIDLRTVALLVGNRSTGKTFIALDWACSVATGRAWQGRPTVAGKVLYVAAEGAYGLDRRVSAWEQAWRHDVVDLDIHQDPVNLLDAAAVAELATIAADYTVVVIDTLARCSRGADENSARDMGIVIDSAYLIRGNDARTVILVHHTGKDRETTRGSSALEAGVDTVYFVEGDPRLLKLSRTKRKDGPQEDVHNLSLVPAADSVFVQSAAGGQDQLLGGSADKLLSVYLSAFSETGATKAELRAAAEMATATFHRALNSLLRNGKLINDGTDHRPHYTAPSPSDGW